MHDILNSRTTSTRAALLAEIHDFVNESGMSADALGRAAVKDGKLIRQLEAGRSIGIDTMDKLRGFMAAERLRRAEPGARRATVCTVEEDTPQVPWWRRFRREK